MATHVPMARVPFAQLDSSRLQHLASAKNRQNGIVHAVSAGKPTLSAPTKRPATFDDEEDHHPQNALVDSENIDPAALNSAKRSKSDNATTEGKPSKPFAFTFTPSVSMPPPPTIPARLSTPARANMSSPRAPLTAPAGRSPKRITTVGGGITKSRRVSAPFTRIDPPFLSSKRGLPSTSLPFSLDAALSSTLAPSAAPATPKLPGATIQESMPKSWFFEIYEDTPEEEATTVMEHSTLTLDLSSDDEGSARAKDDRGKENCPPEGYDAPTASRPAPARAALDLAASASGNANSSSGETIDAPVSASASLKSNITRKRKLQVDAMDDGLRTPLGELETESVVLVGKDGDVKGEIIIWEDESDAVPAVVEG